jgi:type II restriction enzyme
MYLCKIFSSASDIDWQKSVADIDQQLYEKYDFTVDQITFIETKVQDMK